MFGCPASQPNSVSRSAVALLCLSAARGAGSKLPRSAIGFPAGRSASAAARPRATARRPMATFPASTPSSMSKRQRLCPPKLQHFHQLALQRLRLERHCRRGRVRQFRLAHPGRHAVRLQFQGRRRTAGDVLHRRRYAEIQPRRVQRADGFRQQRRLQRRLQRSTPASRSGRRRISACRSRPASPSPESASTATSAQTCCPAKSPMFSGGRR